jgi:protein translocase SecG subunit
MGLFFAVAVTLFVVSAFVLAAFVLIQKGGGSNWLLGSQGRDNVLGVKAVSALFWFTAASFGLFLLLAIVLNRMTG